MFRKVNKVHFVGIGGIGMSGIAELLINLGFKVSGSDLNDSSIIQNLKVKGASILEGHHAKNIQDCEVVVYSSAVPKDNPELLAAHKKNVPIIKRAEMLGELIALKQTSIGVDIGAIEFIRKRIIEMRDAGKAIILISVELKKLLVD